MEALELPPLGVTNLPPDDPRGKSLSYDYFVSYVAYGPRGGPAFGNTCIGRSHPVVSMDDVNAMRDLIARDLPQGYAVCVLNFQSMRTPGVVTP